MTSPRIAVGQLPNRVGHLEGNAGRIAMAMEWTEREAQADVLVFPELALTGYPPGDLVLHRELVEEALDRLASWAGLVARWTARG